MNINTSSKKLTETTIRFFSEVIDLSAISRFLCRVMGLISAHYHTCHPQTFHFDGRITGLDTKQGLPGLKVVAVEQARVGRNSTAYCAVWNSNLNLILQLTRRVNGQKRGANNGPPYNHFVPKNE